MKSKKIFVILLLFVVISGAFYFWYRKKSATQKESFRTETVGRGSIRLTIQATGVTMPQNRLEIKPPISGRIEEMLVNEGDRIKKGQILAWMSSTERAALLDAARTSGEKEEKYWEDTYKPAPLIAPMEGVIIARNMEPGQTITASDAIFVMSDRLIVKAQIDETDIGQLRIGQKSEIFLDAYPNKKISGKTDHIAYEAKTVNNVTIYEVDVLPDRVPPFMRSGMSANITFVLEEKNNILVVTEEAIRRKEDKVGVLVPSNEEGKKRKTKPIRTGISDGKKVEVVEGLSEGDSILIPEMKFETANGGNTGTNPFMPFGQRRSGGSGSTPRR